ncbi:MAG: hypothetical protein AAFV33_16575 [Chloroflexota bacterium]
MSLTIRILLTLTIIIFAIAGSAAALFSVRNVHVPVIVDTVTITPGMPAGVQITGVATGCFVPIEHQITLRRDTYHITVFEQIPRFDRCRTRDIAQLVDQHIPLPAGYTPTQHRILVNDQSVTP